MFDEIKDLMVNGNWGDAQKKFKSMNPTAREFQDYLDELQNDDDLRDWALLGFYTREYEG